MTEVKDSKFEFTKKKKKLSSMKKRLETLKNSIENLENEIKNDYEIKLPKEGIFDVDLCKHLEKDNVCVSLITIEDYIENNFYTDQGEYKAYFSNGDMYCKNKNLADDYFANEDDIRAIYKYYKVLFPKICLVDELDNG